MILLMMKKGQNLYLMGKQKFLIDYQRLKYILKNFCKKSFEKICKSKNLQYLCIRIEEVRFSQRNQSIGY